MKKIFSCFKVMAAVIILCLPVLVHECFHANEIYALTKVQVKEMGFGLPVSDKLSITLDFSENFPVKTFRLNLIPVLAYVNPGGEADNAINNLPFCNKIRIYSAGIIGNFCVVFLLIVPYLVFKREWLFGAKKMIFASGFITFTWMFISEVSLLFPVIGVAFLVSCIKDIKNRNGSDVYGPLGLISLLADSLRTLKGTCSMVAIISISLGYMNMIPLSVMDGGKIVTAILDSYQISHAVYDTASILAVFYFFIYIMYADIKRIFQKA